MEDTELNLDLDKIEGQAEEKLKVKNRFEKLSEKVIVTAKEKEEAEAKAKAEADRADSLSKERDFYKTYSTHAAKYPAAAEFQDKIWDKVKAGYDTEDAILAVLNKEGKLSAPEPEFKPRPHAEGGSAATTLEGDKKPSSREEMRNALIELDRAGELGNALRGR